LKPLPSKSGNGGKRAGAWFLPTAVLIYCMQVMSGICKPQQTLVTFSSWASILIRKLKGPTRPIMLQADRAFLLSALEAIDCVVIFDEETPARLIETVIPDVLVKGGDYIAEEIVGYDTVTKNGGRVEIVPFLEGKSTSGMINLIMENT